MRTSVSDPPRTVTTVLAARRVAEIRELCHDLGNQLATLSCLVEALDSDPELSEKSRHHIAALRTQTTRMLQLLQHALARHPLAERISVRPLIHDVVAAANARHDADVTLLPGAQQWLTTYPAALWRIVDNVVDNAARAAGPAGRVEISVHREQHTVVIEIADNGPGFSKGSAGTAALGLIIATSLASQCDGHIIVLPERPRGTRIRLQFQGIPT